MDAQEYFQGLLYCAERYKSLCSIYESLRLSCAPKGINYAKQPGAKATESMQERYIERLSDIEQELAELDTELKEGARVCFSIGRQNKNSHWAEILYLRYCCAYQWKEIEAHLCLSASHLKRERRAALDWVDYKGIAALKNDYSQPYQ